MGFVLALVLAVAGQPSEKCIATSIELQTFWRAEGPIHVPIGRDVERRGVNLPPIAPSKDQRVILRFRARLTTESIAGWNEYLAVVVNGRAAGPRTADGRPRLVNRPALWHADYRGDRWMSIWYTRSGYPCMNVWFAPDYDTLDKRILEPRHEGYWYVLDITDLVSADEDNGLEFVNTALLWYWHGRLKPSVKLEIDSAEVGVVAERELERLSPVQIERRHAQAGPSISGRGWRAVATRGGGIQVHVGGQLFSLETTYHAEGQVLGLRCASAAIGCKPAVRERPGRLEVTAATDRLELRRTAYSRGGKLVVEDTVANRTRRDLGVKVEQLVIGPPRVNRVYLAGRETLALARPWGAQNCTVHMAADRTAMGVLVLDDFFRCHFSAVAQANWVRMTDEHFGIAAGESYSFKLALYPASGAQPTSGPDDAMSLPANGYWAFINRVRRDIGVNFQIHGPFEFMDARSELATDPDKLRALLKRKKIRIFALGPWLEYYSGARVSRPDYKAAMQRAMATIKKVVPDAICIPRLETNLVAVPVQWFRGTLPKEWGYGHYEKGKPWGKYGIAPPPPAQAIIDASPWRDSMLRDDKGRPLLDTWYILPPYGVVDLMCYPRDGNYRERHMLEQLRFVLDDIGMDGVYIDQFAMSRGTHAYDFGRWDGHTVDLDPKTGRIVRKYAYVGVVSASSRRRIVEAVLRRGKIIVANGPPVSWRLQRLPIFRFMETQGYNVEGDEPPDQPVLATGQLGSPIGLGHQWRWSSSPEAGRCFVRTVIAHLRRGLVYYYYATRIPEGAGDFGPVNEMFPITPVQIGPGFVVGKERVLTCVSGSFKLRWTRRPKVVYFDERGNERQGQAQVSGRPGDWTVGVRLPDLREVAVIR